MGSVVPWCSWGGLRTNQQTSSENLFEMQNFRSHLRPTRSENGFKQPPPPAVRAPQWLTCTLKSEKRYGMTSIHWVSGLGFYFIRTKWWKQWKWRCVSKGRRERQMDVPIKVGGRWFPKVVKGVPDLWPQEQTLKWMGTRSTPSKYQLVQRAQTVCSSGLTFDFLLFGTFSCKARRWHKTSSISLKSPTTGCTKK